MAAAKAVILRVDLGLGLAPVPGARAVAAVRAGAAAAKRKKAAAPARTRAAAGAEVQTSAAARVKTTLKRRFRTTTTLASPRAGVPVGIKAKVKAGAGVRRGEWRRRSAGAGARRRAGVRRKASAGAGAREAAGAAAGVAAKARTRGRGGREAGRRAAAEAAVAAAAAARARGAENMAASETASHAAAARRKRRKMPTAPSPDHGPARCQKSGNVPSLSLARGKVEGRARRLAPIRKPGPGQGPILNPNQTPQNHAPDQSPLQKPDLGPSLDPGLHPDRLPGLDLDPTQDPNWLLPQLELPEKFCTCLVAVAQVIEVEHMSLLYIFNSPNGVSTIVKSKCFLSVKPPGARPSCSTENNLFENPLSSWSTVEYPKCRGGQAWHFLQGALYLDGSKAGMMT